MRILINKVDSHKWKADFNCDIKVSLNFCSGFQRGEAFFENQVLGDKKHFDQEGM